ncbi:hypothetical protein D3C80_2012470 [compost metagenome]
MAAANVLEQAAFVDEFGQRPLRQGRGVQVGQLLGADDRLEDGWRQDGITQPQLG